MTSMESTSDLTLIWDCKGTFWLKKRFEENKKKALDSGIHSDDSVTLEKHYNFIKSYFVLERDNIISPCWPSVELEIHEMINTCFDISKPPPGYDLDEWVKNMAGLHEKFKAEMGPDISSVIKYLIEIGPEGPWKVSSAGVSLEKLTRVDSEVSFEDRRNVTRLFDIYEERILAFFRLYALALSFHKADTIDKGNLVGKILIFCQAGMANKKLCSIPMWNKMVCAVVVGMGSKHEACEEIMAKLELPVLLEMIDNGAFPNKKFGSSLVPLAVQKFCEGDFKKKNCLSNMECSKEFLRVVGDKFNNDILLNLFNDYQTKVDFSTKSGDVKGPDDFSSLLLAWLVFHSMERNEHSIRFMTNMLIRTLVLTDVCELKYETLELLMKIFSRSVVGRAFSVAHFILQPCQETYCKLVQQFYSKYNKNEDDAAIACLDSRTRQFAYHYPEHCLGLRTDNKLVWDLFTDSSNFVLFINVKFFCVKYAEEQGLTKEDLNAFETVENDETARMSLLPTPVAPKKPGNPLHEKYFKTLPYKDDYDIVQFHAKQNVNSHRLEVNNFYKCNKTVCSCSTCTSTVDSTATLADDVDSDDSFNDMWGEYSKKQVRTKLRHGKNGLTCSNVGCDFVASDEESLIHHVTINHESSGFANLLMSNTSEHHHRPRNTLGLPCRLKKSFGGMLEESVGEVALLLRGLAPGAPVHSSDSEETLESESEAFSSTEESFFSFLQRSGVDTSELPNWITETVDGPPSRVASQEEYLDRKKENDEIVPRILNDGDEENRGQEDNSAPNHHTNPVVEEDDVESSYEDDSDYESVIGFSDDEGKEPIIIRKDGEQDVSKIFAKLDATCLRNREPLKYASCPLCVGTDNVTRFHSKTQFDKHIRTAHCESGVLKDMPSFSPCKQDRLNSTSMCSRCNGVVWLRKSHIPAVERTTAFEYMNSLAGGIDRPDSNGEIARFSLEERNVFSEQMMQQCELFNKAGLDPCEVFLAQNGDGKFEILVSGYYKFAPHVRHLFKDGIESKERLKECPQLYENLRITYLLQYNEGTSDYKIKSDMKSCDTDLPSVVHFFARHIAIRSCYKDVPEVRYKLSGQIDPLRIEPMSIHECLNLCPVELNLNLSRCVTTAEVWFDFKSTRALISNNFPPLTPPLAVNIPIYTEESGIMSTSNDGHYAALDLLDAALVRLPEPVETAEQDRFYQSLYAKNLFRKVLKICEELDLEHQEKDAAPTPPPPRPTAGRRGRPRKNKTPSTLLLLDGPSKKVVKHPRALSQKQPENLVATRRSGRINAKKDVSSAKGRITGAEKTVTFMDTPQQNSARRKRPGGQMLQEEPQSKQLAVTPLEEPQSSESPSVNPLDHALCSRDVYAKRLKTECKAGSRQPQIYIEINEMPESSDSTE